MFYINFILKLKVVIKLEDKYSSLNDKKYTKNSFLKLPNKCLNFKLISNHYEAWFWGGYKILVMSLDNYSISKDEPLVNELITRRRQWNLSFLMFFLLLFGVVVFLHMVLNNTNVVQIKLIM